MKITITVYKTTDGKFNAKYETSTAVGSERLKGAETLKDVAAYAEKLMKTADEADLIKVK